MQFLVFILLQHFAKGIIVLYLERFWLIRDFYLLIWRNFKHQVKISLSQIILWNVICVATIGLLQLKSVQQAWVNYQQLCSRPFCPV